MDDLRHILTVVWVVVAILILWILLRSARRQKNAQEIMDQSDQINAHALEVNKRSLENIERNERLVERQERLMDRLEKLVGDKENKA